MSDVPSTYPPIPSQPIKSLEERLAEVEKLRGKATNAQLKCIRDVIRRSAEDCGEIPGIEPPPIKTAKVPDIQRLVARHFHITVLEMISHRRTKRTDRPRMIAMYLCRMLTPRSMPEIGRYFDGRDHTTIMHSVRRVTEMMKDDKRLADKIAALSEILLG